MDVNQLNHVAIKNCEVLAISQKSCINYQDLFAKMKDFENFSELRFEDPPCKCKLNHEVFDFVTESCRHLKKLELRITEDWFDTIYLSNLTKLEVLIIYLQQKQQSNFKASSVFMPQRNGFDKKLQRIQLFVSE